MGVRLVCSLELHVLYCLSFAQPPGAFDLPLASLGAARLGYHMTKAVSLS